MPEVKQEQKQEQPKVEQPKAKVVETAEYKEFVTLNGAVRRDLK